MSALERIRAANKPGPPEHSVLLRVAAAGSVAVGVAACAAEGELSVPTAAVSIVAVAVGSLFSYRRREHPLPWLKAVLALVALGAFWRFFLSIHASAGVSNIGQVEGPLAVLFTWIQVTHAFDVPSRRDLGFSLAGSVTLMAAAAAQAVDMSFACYVVAWAACLLLGLAATWASLSGGRPSLRGLAAGAGGLLVVALVCLVALPAPAVSSRFVFPSALAGDVAVSTPAGLEGTSAGATLPARAAPASGRIGVGGLIGFAGPLDTAIRGSLGDQLVLRVRAQRPSFFVAETFDHWDGQSWTEEPVGRQPWHEVSGSSPFALAGGAPAQGTTDIQTYYLVEPGPNLVFHAEGAQEVWFPASRLYVDTEGNIRSGTSMGPGSIYTVVSQLSTPSVAELAADRGPALPAATLARYTELPHPYPRVAALARRITAHATSTEAKVLALEAWLGRHTRYTTDIPPLGPGEDTVTEFLFGDRRGYCEQISTSLAVMLRTLGIPTREATGYVPGSYNPITDLYQVQAKDAHAWVEVWFPSYGWQSFDPTAAVPLANPSPGATVARDLGHAVLAIPPVPLGAAVLALAAGVVLWRRRRSRPATPAGAVTAAVLRAARRRGLAPRPEETLRALAARVDAVSPPPPGETSALALADAAETAAFGGRPLSPEGARHLVAEAGRLARRGRPRALSPARRPAPRRTRPLPRAGAGRT